ncbi:MAG: PD40 domain-containing protein [Gemmatimonadales bacterium]|nr:PD40 domain-containing protein [Gemmatimonadales bacterium]
MKNSTAVIAALAVFSGAVPAALAQAPGAPGAPPAKPLPLEASRKAEFTATRGTWISLDVSPDGQTIVFDLLGDLYTMPIGGGKATALTTGLAYDAQPRFSPDGKKVVFTSDRSGGDNVWIMSLDKKDTTQLTQGNNFQYISPAFSPDGKYVAVSRGSGTFPTAKLMMFHVDGGAGLPLIPPTPQNAQLKTIGASFTPDGRRVWFAARSGDWHYNAIFPQYQVGYYDRETGALTPMSGRYGSAVRPQVSPDGKWLTYASRHETQTGLRLRDLTTGDEDWLVFPIQRDDMEARATLDALPGYAFTPDSRAVVISYGGEIWRVPLDKSGPSKIPFSADVKLDVGPEVKFVYRMDTTATFTARQIRNPAVSPDGKQLAFVALSRLYLMDLPNGTPRRVTSAEVGEYQPTWSSDGKSLAWITWADAAGGQIMTLALGTRNARPVAATRVAALYTNPVFSPDGSRIVATRQAARDLIDATGHGGGVLGGDFVWVPAAGGDVTVIAPTAGRDVAHFVRNQPDRIYASHPFEGLVSFRWDGTDVKQHVRIVGPMPFFSAAFDAGHESPTFLPRRVAPLAADVLAVSNRGGTHLDGPTEPNPTPTPAGVVLMSPTGGEAVAQINTDVYHAVVPVVGGAVPTVNVAMGGSVPTRKLSDIGGESPSWSADGRTVYFALGNALFSYNLDRAKVVADSLKAVERAKADSVRRAAADTTKPKPPAVDSAAVRDSTAAKDTTKAKTPPVKPGYRPDELRIKVEVRRDLPTGSAVLRGGRAITMKGKEVIENADVVVRNNRIVAVGPRGSVPVPSGARIIDVSGKTLMPGMVDVHYHAQWLIPEIHPGQVWQYLTTLAYGVTTTRDPQTAVSDIVSYQDRVETGDLIGPRIFSTGPGVGLPNNEPMNSLEDAKRVLRRYSDYWGTNTLKMYMSGNRQQRQWIIMAAKELGIMPTTEGGLDYRLDITHAMDGYPGIEHALPITPIYEDVVQLFKASQTTNAPTLLVSYGGPFGEEYFYTTEDVMGDKKLATFMPKGQIQRRALRRGGENYQQGGWFHPDEHVFSKHAEFSKKLIEGGARAAVGAHGQIQGIGNHWELWAMASGGMSNHDALRVATIYGAEAVGLGEDVGSLEPGKMADILVLDANPLENIRNTNTIRYVMKNGRLYDGDTLRETYPRARPRAGTWWDGGPPTAAAGVR